MSMYNGHASLIGAAFGPYQVQALIGRGAMGTVYLARDTTLKRYVALKVLLGHLARNPLLVRRFHREAQATAHLRHPNIVRIYAAGVEAGTPYIAMEFVEGEPLDHFLRRQGRLDWQRALYIGSQVAEALAVAHAHGIVHRDVKPANIMLDRQGRVRLADFGIAHVHTDFDDGPPEESFIGTPRYMSPEQCEARAIGPSTDLFSLGIVLYEMIAGEQPFQGESAVALIKCITNDEPPRLNKSVAGVPDDVARLVAHLLEKKSEDRPRTATDVVERIALLNAQSGGHSALPDALTAFIRDQAQPRALPTGSLALPRNDRDKTPVEQTAAATNGRWLRVLAPCAVVLAAAVVPPAWSWWSPADASVRAATELRTVSVNDVHGVLHFRVPNRQLIPKHLAWLSDGRQIAVWFQGREGTLLQSATGLLGIDTETKQAFSVQAPTVASSDQLDGFSPPTTVSRDLVRPGLFYVDMLLAERSGSTLHQLVACPWQQNAPAVTWTLESTSRATLPWSAGENVYAWHPDGDRIARVERAVYDGMDALIEYELPEGSDSIAPHLLAELAHPIADSVQYAPNGAQIAYVDGPRPGESFLHVLNRDSASSPRRLAAVAPDSDATFSPDSSRIVSTNSVGILQMTSIATGTSEPMIAGRVSRRAWHPSGAFIVLAAPYEGITQMWAMETSRPYRTQLLTRDERGFEGPPVMSADGTRIATWATDDAGTEIVIIPLGTSVFERPFI